MRHAKGILTILSVSVLVQAAFVSPALAKRGDGDNVTKRTSGPPVASPSLVKEVKRLRTKATHLRPTLCRVRACLEWTQPTSVPSLPSGKDLPSWLRIRTRFKHLLHAWTESIQKGKQHIFNPKVRSYMDWEPCVRWYWPDAYESWHCPACGRSGTSRVGKALHTIWHESGGRAYIKHGLFQTLNYDYTSGPENIQIAYRYYFLPSGWKPWPWW